MSEKKNHGLLRFHHRLLVSSSLPLELMVWVDHEVATLRLNTEIRKVLSQNTCFLFESSGVNFCGLSCLQIFIICNPCVAWPTSLQRFLFRTGGLPLFVASIGMYCTNVPKGIDCPINVLPKRVSNAVLLSAILWWLCKHAQHSIAVSHHTSGTPLYSCEIAVHSFTLRTALCHSVRFCARRGACVFFFDDGETEGSKLM